MAPYYNQGKEFRFESNLDDVLPAFFDAIDLFDSRESDRRRLMELRGTPEFGKAYHELGSPDIWQSEQPAETESRLINPSETIEFYDKLKQSLTKRDRRTWRRYRKPFVENVLGELQATINWICIKVHDRTIEDLYRTLLSSPDKSERQNILCNLVEFDSWFLVAPGASDIIRQAAISNDVEFAARLSRALNPKRVTKVYTKHRQRYALTILSCLGYIDRSFSDWAKFFEYYNQQLGEPSGKPIEYAFDTYERWQAVKEAIRAYGIPKNPEKPGRPKSRK